MVLEKEYAQLLLVVYDWPIYQYAILTFIHHLIILDNVTQQHSDIYSSHLQNVIL